MCPSEGACPHCLPFTIGGDTLWGMPYLILILLAIPVVVFVLRLVFGLITAPVATIARLTGWILNLVGVLALILAVVGAVAWVGGDNLALLTIGLAAISVVAFVLSAWVARARRRAAIRRDLADQAAAARQFERRLR